VFSIDQDITLIKNGVNLQFVNDLMSVVLNLPQCLKVRSEPSNFVVRSDPISCLAI